MKTVIVLLAEGFEETEAVIPITLLRRAGINVITVSLQDDIHVRGSRNISVQADICVCDIQDDYLNNQLPDAVFCPGGMPGSTNIAKHPFSAKILQAMAQQNRFIAAICAAPVVVLAPLGLLDGKIFTCYPGTEKQADYMKNAKPKMHSEKSVVQDGNIITSRAAGSASELAFKLIELLTDSETAETVKKSTFF